jgi:hypothetical protein
MTRIDRIWHRHFGRKHYLRAIRLKQKTDVLRSHALGSWYARRGGAKCELSIAILRRSLDAMPAAIGA